MRASFIALVLLCACSQSPPEAALAPDRVAAGSIRYICSITNEEAYVYTTREGEILDPVPTGRFCEYEDFEEWRLQERPVTARETPIEPHHEWLARNRPEA